MTASAGIGHDRPDAYVAGDRRRALARGESLPERVHGSALFADISGFTPVTEALAHELGSHRASEELTANLNRIFHAVIAELDRFGGEVIYFSGDAITCWLDGDDGVRAVACAFAMQEAIGREGSIVTPAGATFQLTLKVAAAAGPAHRFVVGDPSIQLIDVLAGGIVDRIADAERLAEKGDVVLDASAIESLDDRVELAERRGDAGVARRLRVEAAPAPAPPSEEPLPDHLVRPWLLPAVFERLSTGRGEFLAELRPAFPLFLSFGGIDYDDDETAKEKLDELVRAAQRVLTAHGGNLLQLTLGDKGAYLYGVFGTPLAHEDDGVRAAAAALELRALEATTAARDIRVGISHGRLRSGTYGHERRRTFVCLGDAVNLAARLMSKAPAGGIYVSEPVRRAAGDGFDWGVLRPLELRGKAAPVTAFALNGAQRGPTRALRYELPIVGRTRELAVLDAALESALAGRGRVVGVCADAGMGKSRLVAELIRDARARGTSVAFGECRSFGSESYVPWREIVRTLLDVDEALPEREQAVALERAVAELDAALVPRVPLLDVVVGLPIPDNDLTRAFDAKLRKTSLEDLVVACVRGRARAGPLAIVVEDCHWLDPLSRDLLDAVARATAALPVALVLAYRPGKPSLSGLPGLEELPLAALGDDEMTVLIGAKLEQLFGGDGDAAGEVVELVRGRAQGNPFYAEELLNFIHASGVDPADARGLRALELPGSLHSLILNRVDTLPEALRRTLKVASVVGRTFAAPVVRGVYPELGSRDDVRAHVGGLRLRDLVSLDREDAEEYLFRHVVIQEVAYEAIPFALRADLHARAGRYLEWSAPDAIDRNLDMLAHHFWHSDDGDRKRAYLRRAGEAAQAAYANEAAIDYFERLTALLPETERIDVLLRLGEVLELTGDWRRADEVGREALALAEQLGDRHSHGWCEAALAELTRKQGRFDEAEDRLARARAIFEELGEEEGLGRVLHVAGTVATQRGDLAGARERYEASLAIRERLGDRKGAASVLSNLGIVMASEGKLDESRAFHERALAAREALGDRWAIANSLTNLGMVAFMLDEHAEARARFEDAMRLNRAVGDAWMVALTDHNLGNATRGLGDHDAARVHYAASLRAFRGYGDNWATAYLLEDVAQLAALVGETERALQLVGAADTLREQIGAPRAPAFDEQVVALTEDAAAPLSPVEREAAFAAGRALTLGAATELALEICKPVAAAIAASIESP